MEPKQQTEQLGTEKISTLLRNLSVPALIGMFVMTLYNVVDTVFISYGVGIEAVAGTTVAFPMMMIMLAVAAALGVGGSSVISRRLGAQKPEEANLIFGNIITLILLVSVAGILIALFTLEPLLVLFGATPSTIGYAMDYMFPILLGTFFFASGFAANNLVRAEGNARFAMVLMIIPAAINIALDPMFIFGLNVGVRGAAIAVNAMLIEYGTEFYVGIYGIIQRIVMIMALPIMAVMQGMMPIVGYNYGAQNYDRMRETIWLTLKVVTISATSITIILLAIPGPFLRIFTANPEVIEEGSTAMRILFAVFFVVGVQIVAGGLYQALGKPKQALILSLSRQLLILIPLVLILPPYFGVIGVWLAFPISDLLAVVLAVYLLYRDRAPMLVKGKDEDSEKKNVPVMS